MYQRIALLTILLAVVVMVVLLSFSSRLQAAELKSHPATDAYDGWRLGAQAYSFRKFTFYEAVDKTASLGLGWVEAYPGQQLSKEKPDVKFDHHLSAEIRQQVKQKLKDAGLKLVNYGVVGLENDQAQCREVFDFAKDMGIETIIAEPPEEALDMIEGLCKEYKINVAIHNHPEPSHYWNPDTILKLCNGRSKWLGACADTGHWMRSGLNPVESLKKLEGRIISLHFKDLDEGHDVVWGTGKCDVKAMLTELDRQNFRGSFSIEYEYHWETSLPEIRQSVEYFNKVASELKPTGWHDLLESDLSNCVFQPGSWTFEDGVLVRCGERDDLNLWTKKKYGDFILNLEFKLKKDSAGGGIFLRSSDIFHWLQNSIEVQINDAYSRELNKHICGAVYDFLAPSKNMIREPGQWNKLTIMADKNKINIVMNGEQIIDMNLDLWTEAHKNPDGTDNKFNTACKDMAREGFIGFQDYGQPVWYRNIKIKEMTD